MIKIPPGDLGEATLRRVVESFVLREGTDYGLREVSLAAKCRQVLEQLARGDAELWYDPKTDTIDIRRPGRPR